EKGGVTQADATATADASGAHVLVTGGVPGIVDQVDVGCNYPGDRTDIKSNIEQLGVPNGSPPERQIFNGSCAADQVLTPGDRDLYLGATRIDASATPGASTGSEGSVTATGAGLAVGSGDNASFRDLQSTQDNPIKTAGCSDPPHPGSVSQPSGPTD